MLSIGQGHGPDWLMFQHDIRRQSNACDSGMTNNIKFEKEELKCTIYPNPANHLVHLNFENLDYHDFNIQFFDIVGRVFELPPPSLISTSHIFYKFNIADGLYIFKIIEKKSGKSMIKRIIFN